MKTKLIVATICLLLLSGIAVTTVSASDWPELPTDPVTLTVTNLTPLDFPFDIQLSDVDAGFDVSNGLYTGWCVDIENSITRGTAYSVLLYSSLTPPVSIPEQEWDMINYILNNKQGTEADVQAAIWYFINEPNGYWWLVDLAVPYSAADTHCSYQCQTWVDHRCSRSP